MLKHLARLIEKHPWIVVTAIFLVTIGFATLLPSLEMKTDMEEFMPDDELVKANNRIMHYFGGTQPIMFLYAQKQQTGSAITTEALREIYHIQKQLEETPEVNNSVSIATFVDQLCWMEYGTSFENCTDQQIQTVIDDLLSTDETNSTVLLSNDDPDEPIDYKHYPHFSRGKQVNSIDIKNGYIKYNDTTITFAIKVYDLTPFRSNLKPILFTNVIEWYIGFNNLILPSKEMDIHYQIAARIEPKNPFWIIGKKLLPNLQLIHSQLRNRELFNTYKKQVYLWIKPPGENLSYPIALEKANLTFDYPTNTILINVPREELGMFGIAPQFGSFALPAKLTNFTIGTRCYQTPLFKLPWNRIAIDTSFLIETLKKIHDRPLLSKIGERLLENFAGINLSKYKELNDTGNQTIHLPDTTSTKDFETRWVRLDTAPDGEKSHEILFIKPTFFKELQLNAKGFLSKEKNKKPSATIVILQLKNTTDYEETIAVNNKIVDYAKKLDSENPYLSIQATGDGVITAEIHEITGKANSIIGPSIFIIIMLILLVTFRRLSYIVLPLLSLTVSVIWTFGTMVLLNMPFNTMAVAVVPLLMGLGIDYSVHLSHTYRAELEKGKKAGKAITVAIQEVGGAMFLAMLTTVIAFLSFLTATVPPIRNFGIILALGIFYTFINAITLQSSIRYIIDRKKTTLGSKGKKRITLRKSMEKISKIVTTHKKTILTGMVIISLIMGFGALQIKTGFDYKSFLPENNQAFKVFNEIAKKFPYASQDQEYILIEGNVATVKTLKAIKKTMENLDDDTFVARKADGSVKVNSIYTIIQQAASLNKTLIEKYNLDESTKIPKTDRDVKRLYDYLYTSDEYKMQTRNVLYRENNNYKATDIQVYIDPSISLERGGDLNKNIEILQRELNQDIEDYGENRVTITGPLLISHSIANSLTQSQVTSTIFSFILATILLIIAYRKPSLGLIAMVPVGISIIWILGTMHFIGYTLNVLTVTITSLTIGLGIDYAIHATERFRLIADRTGDVGKAVHETISHTGGALLISALTTSAGFGVLILAPMPPEVQFGVITALTIIYAFITSILLLPILLVKWGQWRKRRKGYIISPTKPE